MKMTLISRLPRRALVLSTALGLFFAAQPLSHAQIASDNAGNYDGNWTNGSNEGTGFGEWVLSADGGADGFAGRFIGDPSAAGISGMSSSSFALYANSHIDAFSVAARTLSAPLQIGETFSFQLGINWDSGEAGHNQKGFTLFSGGIGGNQLMNINNAGSAAIMIDGGAGVTTMFSEYGTQAMTLSFQLMSATTLRVFATGRNGIETFDEVFTVAAAPDAFQFYANDLWGGDARQPYFNDFQVIPEPSTYAAIFGGLALLGAFVYRRRARAKK